MSTVGRELGGGSQPATDPFHTHRDPEVPSYPVLTGEAAQVTATQRLGSGAWLVVLIVALGIATAALIGIVVFVAGVLVSSAIS